MAGEGIVQWHDSYSVGIKVIDEQHKKLIALTNKLFDSCMSGHERTKASSKFIAVVHEVVDYVGYHFSTEEKIMGRIKYPDYKIHKKEHANFAKDVLIKVDEFNAGKVNTSLSFVYYLRDWVLQHIAVNDKKLGKYLQEMRQNGDLEQIVVNVKKDAVITKLQVM